jgi:hypothetical protein
MKRSSFYFKLYRETKTLLRRLLLVTDGLKALPPHAVVSIKTSFHPDTPIESDPDHESISFISFGSNLRTKPH